MKRSAPTSTLRPSTRAETPKPGTASKLSVDGSDRPALLGRRNDGLRDRMLGAAFHGRDEPQDLGFREALGGDEIRQLRTPVRQGAGLVEGDDTDFLQALQGLALAEQHARAPPPGRCRP